ncbi:MAG TPA: hypothetical protein VF143_05245 [Candidatus Nanopelagicales bacterium]
MRRPRVRVQLGTPEQIGADLVVLAGGRTELARDGRTVTIAAPRWRLPNGPEHALAEAYREAIATANARRARTMVLPATLTRGPWPIDDLTRVAMTVLHSTPTTVQEVTIAASSVGMLERWAEALMREA